MENEFHRWLRRSPRDHQLILVGQETVDQSERFLTRWPHAVRREQVPEAVLEFTRRERTAHLIYLRSQYEHMEIVNGQKVIPLLLMLMPLVSVACGEASWPP